PKPTPTPTPKPTPTRQLALQAQGGISLGDLPGFGGTVGGAGALLLPRGRGELGARYGPPRPRRVARTDVGADFSLWAIQARACVVPRAGPVEFPLCLGTEAGQLRARPVGLEAQNPGRTPWVATTAAPSIAWAPIRNLAVVLGAAAVVPFIRRQFDVLDATGPRALHRPRPVGLRVNLGLEARFP
ncbi:MAG: hypothetical protein AAF721_20285, partial [Myxococcota bacterium]